MSFFKFIFDNQITLLALELVWRTDMKQAVLDQIQNQSVSMTLLQLLHAVQVSAAAVCC